jgi:hypothetical protein
MNHRQEARNEVIENVRAVREKYAARFNYDIGLLFRHAREQTAQSGQKVIKRSPKPVERGAEGTNQRNA